MIVRFTRPEIRNPLSVFVLEELSAVIGSVDDGACERLIFTGTGEVFASGADLREIAGVTAETARAFAIRGQTLMNGIAAFRCTTVAAVNGFCFGGALDLAIACDKRVAHPNAQFSHPGVNLGIMTGWGGTQRLPRLIGQAGALGMFMTGGRFGADEALRMSLIDEIAGDVVERACEI